MPRRKRTGCHQREEQIYLIHMKELGKDSEEGEFSQRDFKH